MLCVRDVAYWRVGRSQGRSLQAHATPDACWAKVHAVRVAGSAARGAGGAKGAPAKPGQKRERAKSDDSASAAKRPRGPRLRLPRVLTGPHAISGHPVALTAGADAPPFLKARRVPACRRGRAMPAALAVCLRS